MKITKEELIMKAAKADLLEEEIKNLEAFVTKILSYEDLPASHMVLDDIIEEARALRESAWMPIEPGEEW
tara:strand:+ start:1963 stop:2172 length:210 start_codon:yes stop_codon:yes gene_type:complete